MPASPDHDTASDSDFDEKALEALEAMDTESEAATSDDEGASDVEIRLGGVKGPLAPSSFKVMQTPRPMPIEADDDADLAKDVAKASAEQFGAVVDSSDNMLRRTVVYATGSGIVQAVVTDQAMALTIALKLKKGAKSALKVADAKKVLARSKKGGKPWTEEDFDENGHPLFCSLAAAAKAESRKKVSKTADGEEKKKAPKPEAKAKDSPAPKRPTEQEPAEQPKPKRAKKRVEPARVQKKEDVAEKCEVKNIRTLTAPADHPVWEFVDAAIQAHRDSKKADGGVAF